MFSIDFRKKNVFSPMEEYVGKKLKILTSKGHFEGIMNQFDKKIGIISLQSQFGVDEFNFDEIINVNIIEETNEFNDSKPLKEADMYALFYEAFNVYGPFEDHFIFSVAVVLKKFLRDFSAASIKIIIGSDDIFGRIGLCFARLSLGKTALLSVDLKSEIYDLKTMQYKNAFENSGGIFNLKQSTENYYLRLFASNRNYAFESDGNTSNQTILLDIPETLPFSNFTGIGLGFVPENFKVCNRFFYLLDVGFGPVLCKKYKIPSKYKSSLVKVDLPK